MQAKASELVEFYRIFQERLIALLLNKGVSVVKPQSDNTMPKKQLSGKVQISDDNRLNHISHAEEFWYTFSYRSGLLRFTADHIGVHLSGNALSEDQIAEFSHLTARKWLLAVCSSGDDIYWLDESGLVSSTALEWEKVRLFERVEECRRICSVLTSDMVASEIDERRQNSQYSAYNIISIGDLPGGDSFIYFDLSNNIFIKLNVEGNFYHGYDVEYSVCDKSNVLDGFAHGFYSMQIYAARGYVPPFAIADHLTEKIFMSDYKPPVELGRGELYI